jgi:hypothetical protein
MRAPDHTITIYETHYKLDDVADGDFPRDDVRTRVVSYAGTLDDVYDPESDTTRQQTPVEWATELLRNEGLTEYSAYPDWQRRGWYSNPDGSYHVDNIGSMCQPSGHLAGFSEAESRQLHALVTGRNSE